MKFYISGAIQGSSDIDSARVIYEQAAGAVEQAGARAYVPMLEQEEMFPKPDSVGVYETDLQAILESNGIIVFLDEPSLGTGAEIILAQHHQKSILAVIGEGKSFSRFIEGLFETSKIPVYEYDGPETLSEIIQEHVSDRLGALIEI